MQFTPRVATSEEAVLLELEASARLFGGKRALRDPILQEGADQGVTALAWATNSLAAHLLARAGIENGFKRPLEELLDTLPMRALTAVAPHEGILSRLGCRTLGDVRRLPRGGLSRRFDKLLLGALDRAYGLQPEAHVWVELRDLRGAPGAHVTRRNAAASSRTYCTSRVDIGVPSFRSAVQFFA